MNIFSQLRSYAGKWNKVAERHFNQEEKDSVQALSFVEGGYGTSACFLMADGSQRYIPVSRDADLSKAEEVTMDDIRLITLERGNEFVTRVEF